MFSYFFVIKELTIWFSDSCTLNRNHTGHFKSPNMDQIDTLRLILRPCHPLPKKISPSQKKAEVLVSAEGADRLFVHTGCCCLLLTCTACTQYPCSHDLHVPGHVLHVPKPMAGMSEIGSIRQSDRNRAENISFRKRLMRESLSNF